jgi:4-alpha-glucanotransferase
MTLRASGLLLHPISLPNPFGIGDLGPAAFRFVDFLNRAKQCLWQILPVSPTEAGYNDSPYHSVSNYAGNPLLISPEWLVAEGWLKPSDIENPPEFPSQYIDYRTVRRFKFTLLRRACEAFVSRGRMETYKHFCACNGWLRDYALFTTLSRHFANKQWCDWPAELRERRPQALREAEERFNTEIERITVEQFFFYSQWQALHAYCQRQAVRIIGDMPIYVPFHSTDVWVEPQLFKLDKRREPLMVSGVPPDYFSRTGQLWGHPVYDWDQLRAQGFRWWLDRTSHLLSLVDELRIDHFRGLVSFWEVPAGEKTALKGHWREAPAAELLAAMSRRFGQLPLIAEDLGTIDAQVRETMQQFQLPGMRVLLFAFGDDFPNGSFLPHAYPQHCVAYTGTHDNNTVLGWYRHEAGRLEKERLRDYLGRDVPPEHLAWELTRLLMQSAANRVILPVQDLLGLDKTARMNQPARRRGNWRWRLGQGALNDEVTERLGQLTALSGRAFASSDLA